MTKKVIWLQITQAYMNVLFCFFKTWLKERHISLVPPLPRLYLFTTWGKEEVRRGQVGHVVTGRCSTKPGVFSHYSAMVTAGGFTYIFTQDKTWIYGRRSWGLVSKFICFYGSAPPRTWSPVALNRLCFTLRIVSFWLSVFRWRRR